MDDMHPKSPAIDEKTLTIKGLIVVCDDPSFLVDKNGLTSAQTDLTLDPEDADLLEEEKPIYLCTRCKAEIGGALEKRGAKIRRLSKPKA